MTYTCRYCKNELTNFKCFCVDSIDHPNIWKNPNGRRKGQTERNIDMKRKNIIKMAEKIAKSKK